MKPAFKIIKKPEIIKINRSKTTLAPDQKTNVFIPILSFIQEVVKSFCFSRTRCTHRTGKTPTCLQNGNYCFCPL